jgi:UDP-N-acetylglucosamine acyltransferase
MNSVSSKATIGGNVKIGEFTVVRDDVVIGNNVEILSSVLIDDGARISDNVKICHGSAVSVLPQDLKFKGEKTFFEIGEGTTIREFVTLNRGTKFSYKSSVGKNCFLMAYVHVAHDCRVGDNVVLANAVNMGGHVEIEDWVIVGGMVAVHQFVKIGQHSMIGGGFKVVKDVPPYIIAGNMPLRFEGVNKIGLQRRGFTSEQIVKINEVYNIIYKSKYNVTDALKKVKDDIQQDEYVKTILDFIENSKRGIIRGQFSGQ